MPKAYSYIRFSTPEQMKGNSFERQTDASKDYAEQNGLELVQNYSDLGISAYKGKNAENALGEFLKAVKQDKIEKGSFLLVESLDRLSRDKVLTAFNLFTSILEKGITIVTLQDNQVYTYERANTDIGSLFTSLGIMVRANNESEVKSDRVGKAWANKRKNATDQQKPMTARCPSWLRLKKDRSGYEVIESHAKTVQKIFDLAENGVGLVASVRILNSENVAFISYKKASKWGVSFLQRILTNRSVLGEFQPHRYVNDKRIPDGDPIKNYFPAIITETQFNNVQKIRKDRQKNKGQKGKVYTNLFSRILICSECGERYRLKNPGTGRKEYVECYGKAYGLKCNSHSWKLKEFEETFFTFINEIDVKKILKEGGTELDDLQKEKNSLEYKLSMLDEREKKIETTLAESTDISLKMVQMLDKQLKVISEERSEMIKRINDISLRLDGLKVEHYQGSVNNLESFQRVMKDCRTDNELYKVRARIAQEIRNLIDKIELVNSFHLTDADIFEIENMPENFHDDGFIEFLKQKEDRFGKSGGVGNWLRNNIGKKHYNIYRRYFIVTFKSGKRIEVSPNIGKDGCKIVYDEEHFRKMNDLYGRIKKIPQN